MKRLLLLISIVLLTAACNLINPKIDGDEVKIDDSTRIFTFKKNNELVNGTVIFQEVDPKTGRKFKQQLYEVKDGKRVNKGYKYYPSGSIRMECQYDSEGLITGTLTYYTENGKIGATYEYQKNKPNGAYKEYDEKGIQIKEILYKAGTKVRAYEFENGNKIIPAIDKMELISYETGFYEYRDFNSYQLLYQPIVIMKWKNISNEPIGEMIEIEGIFIDNEKGEEWSKSSDYFQGYSDPPLQPGLARQAVLQSSVGYTGYNGITNANISCQILINKQLYKTIKVKNELRMSNRIQ